MPAFNVAVAGGMLASVRDEVLGIEGMRNWFRASAEDVSLGTGTQVATLNDLTGSGHTMLQATAGKRGDLTADLIDGPEGGDTLEALRCLHADGDFYTHSNTPDLNSGEISIVGIFKMRETGTLNRAFIASQTSVSVRCQLLTQSAGILTFQFGTSSTLTRPYVVGEWAVVTIVITDDTVTLRVNGSAVSTAKVGAAPNTSLALRINNLGTDTTWPPDADWSDFMIFTSDVLADAGALAALGRYADIYGLTI